jgi:DNA-binding transcriptional LysR family regulator
VADLRALRALEAVVRLRSFTRAGEELHVAQQAVSRTVASLEDQLGVSLVERTTRSVDPTAAGIALADDARRLLADFDRALDRVRELGGAPPDQVRLGLTPGIGAEEAARLLDLVAAALPQAAVEIVETRPGALDGMLRDGRLHAAIMRSVPDGARNVHAVALPGTPAVLAVPDGHPLASRPSVDATALPAGTPLLVFSAQSAGTRMLLDLAGPGVEPVVSSVVGRGGSLRDVAAGKAVAITAAGEAPRTGVTLVPIDPPVLLPVHVITRAGDRRETVRRVVRALRGQG